MGCHGSEEHDAVCEHEEALDVISEFVLIAHCTHDDGENNSVIQLGNTKYINAPLRKKLEYEKGTLPPPGMLENLVLKEDGRYHGTATLAHSDQSRIYLFIFHIIRK